MSDTLARHFERCPVCSTLDEDGNERVCRTARELAREAVQERQVADREEILDGLRTLIRRSY